MPLRIIVADDHALFRHGLRAVLQQQPDIVVVAEAADGHETLRRVADTEADVLLLDLRMPGGISGARTAEEALRLRPHLAIVVLTMHEDEYYLREMLAIGVQAYVLKKSHPEALLEAIRAAARGEQFVDPALMGHLVTTFVGRRQRRPRKARLELLTPRERQVAALVALGYTNAEIGRKLAISEKTVETHRRNVMTRLELRNRAELVRFAIDNGLVKFE